MFLIIWLIVKNPSLDEEREENLGLKTGASGPGVHFL